MARGKPACPGTLCKRPALVEGISLPSLVHKARIGPNSSSPDKLSLAPQTQTASAPRRQRGLRSASSGHRSQGCHTSGTGVRRDAPAPAGLLSPSADPSTPEESTQAPPALRLPTSACQTGKPVHSRTVLLWNTSWLLSPGDLPHFGWCSHGRGTQRLFAPGQGLSRASQPMSCSPQGDAPVSPSGGCAPKHHSLLPN